MKQTAKNVQPLRSKEEIEEMKFALKRGGTGRKKSEAKAARDVLLFLLGINTGLRISDLLRLQVSHVRDRDFFYLIEKKTGKKREVNVRALRSELGAYIAGKGADTYLFSSQKGGMPISTVQAYRILADAAAFVGRDDVGTHTLRKTFGYHYYKATKDVAMLQDIFNHSSPKETKLYIGIRQEEIRESLVGFRLG
ncbi:site-specific integrase (plasmid) [Salimicrobium jeotgali]|uniref:Integrase n=1 Tax=Salimicrobium jeotgali TaxID=1230341 RepID=K2G931_9BACI|nr:tyrosine-type recombinase/integrase [Salimicrobium jeotgali]AKN01833.1 site-specific integrase [Salimicrobium jeotgali]EKE30897.1 integrase [Salimicrobium jeotgali]MBM7697587.1 integrase [Salimicrobium jeotgali]